MHPAEPGSDADPATWTYMRIEIDPDFGPTSVNMTYDRPYGTGAMLSEKAGRMIYTDGCYEPAIADHLEMAPRVLNFLFQPAEFVFVDRREREHRLTPDILVEFADGAVRFGEIKASAEWFAAPVVAARQQALERAMELEGLGPLMRVCGAPFIQPNVSRASARLIRARLTPFRRSEVDSVLSLIAEQGGTTTIDHVARRLGLPLERTIDLLSAMMLRRHVAIDQAQVPHALTTVRAVAPARPWALKALLTDLAGRGGPGG